MEALKDYSKGWFKTRQLLHCLQLPSLTVQKPTEDCVLDYLKIIRSATILTNLLNQKHGSYFLLNNDTVKVDTSFPFNKETIYKYEQIYL